MDSDSSTTSLNGIPGFLLIGKQARIPALRSADSASRLHVGGFAFRDSALSLWFQTAKPGTLSIRANGRMC